MTTTATEDIDIRKRLGTMCTPIVCALAKLYTCSWSKQSWTNTGIEGALVLCIDRTPPLSKCLRILSLSRAPFGQTSLLESKNQDAFATPEPSISRDGSIKPEGSPPRQSRIRVDPFTGADLDDGQSSSRRSASHSRNPPPPPSPRLPPPQVGAPVPLEAITVSEAEIMSTVGSERTRAQSENAWESVMNSRRRDSDISSLVTSFSSNSSGSGNGTSKYLDELFCEELYEGFELRELSPTFYAFPIPHGLVGLAFASVSEAQRFTRRVQDLAPRRTSFDTENGSDASGHSTSVFAKIGRWFMGGSGSEARKISAPESFQHQMHFGADGSSFLLESAPAEWRAVFEAVGLQAQDFSQPPIMAAVLNAVAGAVDDFPSQTDSESTPEPSSIHSSTSLSRSQTPIFHRSSLTAPPPTTTTTNTDVSNNPSESGDTGPITTSTPAVVSAAPPQRRPPPPSRAPPAPPHPTRLPPLVPSRKKQVENALREALAQYGLGSRNNSTAPTSAASEDDTAPPKPRTLPPPTPPASAPPPPPSSREP